MNQPADSKRVSIFQEFGVSDPLMVEMDSDTAAFLIQRAWRRYHSDRIGSCSEDLNTRRREETDQQPATTSLIPLSQPPMVPSLSLESTAAAAAAAAAEAAEEEVAQRTLATSGYMTTSLSSCFSDMRNSNSFSDWRVSASNTEDNLQRSAMTAGPAATDAPTPLRVRRLEQLKEADSLSIMSDCSELMGEVGKLLKEQLASQDALLRPRLHPLPGLRKQIVPATSASANASAATGGAAAAVDDEDARREQRKANFLSLAQEFAELKRRNADALPFNLHRLGRSCGSPTTSESSSASPTPPESSESPDDESGSGGGEGGLYRLVPVPLSAPPQMQQMIEEEQRRRGRYRLRREERLQGLFPHQHPHQQHRVAARAEDEEDEPVALRRSGLSERERVLQALSMSAEDEDSGLASMAAAAAAAAAASSTASCTATSGFGRVGGGATSRSVMSASAGASISMNAAAQDGGNGCSSASHGCGGAGGVVGGGMQMCFRNDAASDTECSEVVPPTIGDFSAGGGGGGGGGGGCGGSGSGGQRVRHQRRSSKGLGGGGGGGFTAPKVSEAAAPMQLCFISDLTSDEEDSASANSSTLVSDSGIGDPFKGESRRRGPLEAKDLAESQCTTATSSSLTAVASIAASVASSIVCQDDGAEGDNEDLLVQQARLQAEAQLALAQARPMARMQLEVERHEQRSRASRDLVAELIGVSSSNLARRFHKAHLQQLSVGALQFIHNDLLSRIETHNEELVRSLIERDDLHMEQDAMLVEIEDLTRRAQEVANRLQEAPLAAASAAAMSPQASAAASDKSATASPVRGRMSSLTSRLKPTKLVSLFTGGGN